MAIDILFERIQKLPIMPMVVSELLAEFNNPDFDIPTAVRLVKKDQVLSARVLKLANSSVYHRGKPIHSIDEAAIRLGLNPIKSLVVACGFCQIFPHIAGIDQQGFWLQTYRIAELCRILAQCCQLRTDTAYTCGILHNIGEMLICIAMPEEAGLIQLAVQQGDNKLQAQQRLLGVDFVQAGAELARRWKLAPIFINAIAFQQDPLGNTPFSAEAALIRMAAFIDAANNKGLPLDTIVAYLPSKLTELFHMDRSRLTGELTDCFSREQDGSALSVIHSAQ